jgi:hypothetical protein
MVASLGLAASAAEDLGTLFFTPQERAALDRMRRGEPESPSVARMARHSVTGFVRRSDGRNTVWIDGAPISLSGSAPEAILPLDSKREDARANGGVRVERKGPR